MVVKKYLDYKVRIVISKYKSAEVIQLAVILEYSMLTLNLKSLFIILMTFRENFRII